jgi:hypothetical protein
MSFYSAERQEIDGTKMMPLPMVEQFAQLLPTKGEFLLLMVLIFLNGDGQYFYLNISTFKSICL